MTDMDRKLYKIVTHFGLIAQLVKLKEEVDELIEAIKENDISHMHEEMADVEVMLGQIYRACSIDKSLVEVIAEHKVHRTLDRIRTGYYERRHECEEKRLNSSSSD